MSERPAAEEGSGSAVEAEPEGEWSGWTHPTESDGSGGVEGADADPPERASWKAPPAERPATVRERIRRRLGLDDRAWYVVETLLLVAPYPVFVLVYLSVPVDETAFLAVTLLYSLFASYVGLLS